MRLTFFGQQGIASTKMVHLAMKKAELPENFKRLFHQFLWREVVLRIPGFVNLCDHAIEKLTNDFLFIGKMKIQIPRTDAQVFRDVIGCDGYGSRMIVKFHAGVQDALAISTLLNINPPA